MVTLLPEEDGDKLTLSNKRMKQHGLGVLD